MTDTEKSVTRCSVGVHTRHQKKFVVTIGPRDVVGIRLQHGKQTYYLDLQTIYDQAEMKSAKELAGFNIGPCKDPKRVRNVVG